MRIVGNHDGLAFNHTYGEGSIDTIKYLHEMYACILSRYYKGLGQDHQNFWQSTTLAVHLDLLWVLLSLKLVSRPPSSALVFRVGAYILCNFFLMPIQMQFTWKTKQGISQLIYIYTTEIV